MLTAIEGVGGARWSGCFDPFFSFWTENFPLDVASTKLLNGISYTFYCNGVTFHRPTNWFPLSIKRSRSI